MSYCTICLTEGRESPAHNRSKWCDECLGVCHACRRHPALAWTKRTMTSFDPEQGLSPLPLCESCTRDHCVTCCIEPQVRARRERTGHEAWCIRREVSQHAGKAAYADRIRAADERADALVAPTYTFRVSQSTRELRRGRCRACLAQCSRCGEAPTVVGVRLCTACIRAGAMRWAEDPKHPDHPRNPVRVRREEAERGLRKRKATAAAAEAADPPPKPGRTKKKQRTADVPRKRSSSSSTNSAA